MATTTTKRKPTARAKTAKRPAKATARRKTAATRKR